MPTSPTQCDHERLRKSLDDVLSETQEEELAQHLDACEECRDRLERLAGGANDWSKIEVVLQQELSKASSFPPGSLTTLDLDHRIDFEHSQSAELHRQDDDFAVDFLKPTENKDALGRLNNIEIRSIIGRGGNGIVLKGFQEELNRLVAVKVMAPQLATSAAARKRFAREAQATAAIVHPNVMPILTVHSESQLPYLVMPFVDCESLQDRLDREGSLPVIDVLRIAHQVANGLAAAHAQGLVHRDVKPANILLEKAVDRVMLTDFGLARAADDATLTRTGVIAGTPQYMSPEQARGDRVDARSDLFSLGSVMYAMSTGRAPFRAETSYGILRRVTDEQPRTITELNADIPAWLHGLINKLMSKLVDDRCADAERLARQLEECVAHTQQPSVNSLPKEVSQLARSVAEPNRIVVLQKAIIKHPIGLTAIIVLLLAIVVGTAFFISGRPSEMANEPDDLAFAQKLVITAAEPESNERTSVSQSETSAESDRWCDDIDQQLNELDADMDSLLRSLKTP